MINLMSSWYRIVFAGNRLTSATSLMFIAWSSLLAR
jgi:hypothetical protein